MPVFIAEIRIRNAELSKLFVKTRSQRPELFGGLHENLEQKGQSFQVLFIESRSFQVHFIESQPLKDPSFLAQGCMRNVFYYEKFEILLIDFSIISKRSEPC